MDDPGSRGQSVRKRPGLLRRRGRKTGTSADHGGKAPPLSLIHIFSVDTVTEQAEKYGHSERRELAFLVAHSMLHLCGYDHMEDGERLVMEEKQEEILKRKGYER